MCTLVDHLSCYGNFIVAMIGWFGQLTVGQLYNTNHIIAVWLHGWSCKVFMFKLVRLKIHLSSEKGKGKV